MDELELLKSRWHKQDSGLPQLTYTEIYKMLLKKSSSIVKWILFISIGEIVLWTSLALLVPESSRKFSDDIGLHNVMLISNILYYTVFFGFIIIFYKNYRRISTTDSIKKLMGNIIRTRRTVKYFIIYNLVSTSLMLIGINVYYYSNKDQVFNLMVKDYGVLSTMDREQFFTTFFLVQFLIGLGVVVLIYLFYRFVYVTLLRRLKKNYHELQKMQD